MINEEILTKLREGKPIDNMSVSEEASKKVMDNIIGAMEKTLENENENDDHANNSNESTEGGNKKQKIDFSITRENNKIINSSETIPLNSVLVNIIGATIGNCSKNGDEFKFNLNVEEDGSINLQIHAPNNKLNNILISKLFDIVSDENNMDSKILNIIYNIASKISSVNNGSNSSNNYSKNPWSTSPWSSKI